MGDILIIEKNSLISSYFQLARWLHTINTAYLEETKRVLVRDLEKINDMSSRYFTHSGSGH
jgi:hypothetical protein